MDVDLTRATHEDDPVLVRLFQLYSYDFSEILGLEIGDDGVFTAGRRPSGYWTGPRYRPFLLRAGGHLAGFAIVGAESWLTGDALWDMDQFFVLRRHRCAGVGARAATLLFDAFPGRWEVREEAGNAAAQAFWRKVIERYTGGRFEETILDDARWHGPVQRFERG
jgi:predicted acetyltransferase